MSKVLNKRMDTIPPDAVYVGRPSKWGNPFHVVKGGDHQGPVDMYRMYLGHHPELVEAAKQELRGKDLSCWCTPLPCHGDVLLEIANEPTVSILTRHPGRVQLEV